MIDIKVIIMDVDGTLTNETKKVLPATKEALMKAQEKGIRLILASGRPTIGLIELGKELEMDKHHGLFVSYNGSKVVDCQTMEELFDQPLTVEEAKAVLHHMKKFEVNPMIDHEEYMYVNNAYEFMVEYESHGGGFLVCEKTDLEEFVDFRSNKILTSGQPEYLKEHYQEMMEPFIDKLSCMFTSAFYFEFTAKGIDKAKALKTVLEPMGYKPENLMTFGDGHNDASMVKYSGLGVAMDNAVQDLKDIADYVTASNEEDGIAKALYKYVLKD